MRVRVKRCIWRRGTYCPVPDLRYLLLPQHSLHPLCRKPSLTCRLYLDSRVSLCRRQCRSWWWYHPSSPWVSPYHSWEESSATSLSTLSSPRSIRPQHPERHARTTLSSRVLPSRPSTLVPRWDVSVRCISATSLAEGRQHSLARL